MDFETYQKEAFCTEQDYVSGEDRLVVPLLGLAGEVGELLSEYKKRLRDGSGHANFEQRIAEELGDLLWYLSNIATKSNLSLSDIAKQNLVKVKDRWGARKPGNCPAPQYDEKAPDGEKIPREFEVILFDEEKSGQYRMIGMANGIPMGNPLTDNAYVDDGYRFHDASIEGVKTITMSRSADDKIFLQGTREALRTRRDAGISLTDPICPFDFAELLKLQVRFEALPSLEGIYSRDPGPVVILSCLRPYGRQAFTCAHEIGHHILGHGFSSDELKAAQSEPERMADAFAGSLLMPKSAISHAFSIRNWSLSKPKATQIYSVSCQFGVSYEALIQQLRIGNLISASHARELLKFQPKQIKALLIGNTDNGGLVLCDYHWRSRPVDLQVGDFLLVPNGTLADGELLAMVQQQLTGMVLLAQRPGIGRLLSTSNSWSIFVRISRERYVGLNRFRHLADD